MKKTISVKTEAPFWIGEKVYVIERDEWTPAAEFRVQCPACKDTRKLKAVGADGVEYETDCPLCISGKRTDMTGYNNILRLKKWKLTEYAINRIELAGPEAKVRYGKGKEVEVIPASMHAISMHKNITLPIAGYFGDKVDVPVDTLGEWKDESKRKTLFYHKRSDAAKVLELIRGFDKDRLSEFNKTYGCTYEYPW